MRPVWGHLLASIMGVCLAVPCAAAEESVRLPGGTRFTLEVEAGQTYYVQGVLGVGIVAGRPNLTPSDAATFEGLKAKLKEVPPLTGDDDGDE